ncbi:hypothetical protein H5410_032777 [Solanum commersonii]|uniref:DUF1985 domain-containing protein n=1 Tax=Solanum commersonii TaxID=4109 RepID=A0A9J5YNW1_SOLCO|nr:hypothetical protein H5410_032777 [Solanum commersonii]
MSVLFLNMRIKSLALSKGLVYLLDCLGTSQMRFMSLCMIRCPHLGLTENYALRFKSCLQCCQSTFNPADFMSKKTEPTGQFLNLTRARKNLTHSNDYGVFVAAYTEFLSEGLQIPSDGIISQSLRLRYTSLLWNYRILKAQSGYVSNNEDLQRPRHKKAKKIVLTKEITDTKIQKRPRTRTCRKKNENSTTTLLEELASEAVSSSQVEAEFSQKEYEEREKEKNEVDNDGERAEEVEEEKGNKKEVEEDKGKQKEVEEEEGKNKEVVEEEEEKINEVDEDKGKQKEVEEDGIKTINAHTFLVHLQPNATGDSIMRSAMGKPFDTFRITLKQNGLEDIFRNSYFGHFLDLPENNNARFQMTIVYELLKRRFIFQNPEKNDEVLINYCGMPLFFSRREFVIVSGLKCYHPSEPVPEFIVKKDPRKRKKREKEEIRQSTEEQDLVSFVGTSFKNPNLIYLLNVKDTPRKHKKSLCLLWFVHNVLLAKDLNNNISLKWMNLRLSTTIFGVMRALN